MTETDSQIVTCVTEAYHRSMTSVTEADSQTNVTKADRV